MTTLMSIPVHTVAAHLEQGHPVIPDAAVAIAFPDPVIQQAIHITQSLQTTLDLTAMIELFYNKVSAVVPVDGMEYHHAELGHSFECGRHSRHSCHYHLRIETGSLGDLTFRRRRAFVDSELAELEFLLCTLLYPLRNGLLYQEAVARAQKDPLTGLYNRAALDESLAREISLAHRHATALSLVILDIDHFKRVNDRFGHCCGDDALCAVVERARQCARNTDMLFRYGGEEFVILLRNTDQHGAQLLAERLRKKIVRTAISCSGEAVSVTISAGVASLRDDDDAGSLFARADSALYEAKRAGRNRVAMA
jgi:diguanylate cyclase (GGDEF)-like protein